jgi:hypothetical protein
MGSDEGAASVTKKAARAGAAFDVKVAGALQAAPGPESEDAMKYRHLGDVSTPSSVLSSTPFSNNPIFRAIRLLEAFGFRVLPPKPTKTGKRGRPKTFMMPEMKVALLGAAEAELAGWKATRRPSDDQLVRRLQKKGYFTRWKYSSLRVELSRARRWALSVEGRNWIEHAARTIVANNPELFAVCPLLAPA